MAGATALTGKTPFTITARPEITTILRAVAALPTPERGWVAGQLIAELDGAVSALRTVRQEAAVELWGEGASYAEVGDLLGISQAMAGRMIADHRAAEAAAAAAPGGFPAEPAPLDGPAGHGGLPTHPDDGSVRSPEGS